MKSALPLLLGVGAIAAFAMGSRKKKPAPATSDPYTDLPKGDEEDPELPGLEDPPIMEPPPPRRTPPPNPAGPGPWGNYDHDYWEKGDLQANNKNIRDHFRSLGYIASSRGSDDYAMNVLGPKGDGPDMLGNDGNIGKLGGGDDEPSTEVAKFQSDYNRVSKSKTLIPGMGELISDGFVGPETLNALKIAKENLNGKLWPDIVKTAQNAGF